MSIVLRRFEHVLRGSSYLTQIVNIISSRKREHSDKPDELYPIIEVCSPGPYLELFARHKREGWRQWGSGILTSH
jgi:N6-adenosine-specific RNA methylase IME4